MEEVLKYLKKLLKHDDTIVVATSGGPDSMCLLHLLCELKSEYSLHIVVAHVNHKLRCESEEEAKFVEAFSKEHHLIYEYMEIQEYHHDNLENEARMKRYEFFRQLILKYQAKYLMTAHHGDDLMETILMRLVRGSSIKGYAGFKKEVDMKTYQIIRPLISVTKSDILEYMDHHKYPYFLDQSNTSRKYTRNRYRMDVLPFLKQEDPKAHLKFLKFSEELDAVNHFVDTTIQTILKDIKNENGIFVSKLLELDDFLIKKIVEYEFSLIYINDLFLVSDKNCLAVIHMLKDKKTMGRVMLPNGYVALKEYNLFKIVYPKKENEYEFILDCEVKVPLGVVKKINMSDSKSNYIIRLNRDDLKLPLIIRNRRDGDKIEVKNLNGHKKVKDIFIDEKVPKDKRDKIPLVLDSSGHILWVCGVKKSKFDVESNEKYDIILSYEEEKE